jgi:hypothetical protein
VTWFRSKLILEKVTKMAEVLDELVADEAALATAVSAAVAEMQALSAQLSAALASAPSNTAALQDLHTKMQAQIDALSAATVAVQPAPAATP